MKGYAKLKKFADACMGKSITDLIEVLYSVEVEAEHYFDVFASVRKVRKDKTIWIDEPDAQGGKQVGDRTRENAVDFLMMKDMENKYVVYRMNVSRYSKYVRCSISLIDRDNEVLKK